MTAGALVLAWRWASAKVVGPTVRLADGGDMPIISLGTGGLHNPEVSVNAGFDVGFVAVDSALDYGNQFEVGRALATRPRSSYWLTSKIPGCLAGTKVLPPFCREMSLNAIKLGNERLNVTYTDLMLIHFPPATAFITDCGEEITCLMLQGQWRAMEDAKAAGLTKSIGVSNYCPSCLECLKRTARELPVVNQVEFHVGMGPDAQGFKSYFAENHVTLMAYSPLGPWLGSGKGELIKGNLTTSIGRKHNRSSVQVALRWLSQRGVPFAAKSANPEHLKEDVDNFDWSLDSEDLRRLDAATIPAASRDSPSFVCSAGSPIVV